jgi:hypothetical protein
MAEHVIRMIGQLHGHARLPLGPARLAPVLFRSDPGAGPPSPSEDGVLEEFFEFCPGRAASSATCA